MENDNVRVIDSIIKARDDRTKENTYETNDSFLYSIMLSHIENIQANLYNFKFIAKTLSPEINREIYLNMQILINDDAIIKNSKYYIENDTRLKLVNSYNFEKKENFSNSYRLDFSMNGPSNEKDMFLKLEIINIESNTSTLLSINKEMFFKISIFLYQLLSCNIIDGNIFYTNIIGFRNIIDKDILIKEISTIDSKVYNLYWNNRYIICFIIGLENRKQLVYSCFTKEEYEDLLRSSTQI